MLQPAMQSRENRSATEIRPACGVLIRTQYSDILDEHKETGFKLESNPVPLSAPWLSTAAGRRRDHELLEVLEITERRIAQIEQADRGPKQKSEPPRGQLPRADQ